MISSAVGMSGGKLSGLGEAHQVIVAELVRVGFGTDAEVRLHHGLHGRMVCPVFGQVRNVGPGQAVKDVVGEPAGGVDQKPYGVAAGDGLGGFGSKGRFTNPDWPKIAAMSSGSCG